MTSGDASYFTYNTPVGKVTIGCDGDAVVRLVPGEAVLIGTRMPTALTNAAATQLQEYFAGKRRIFDIPVKLAVSSFQRDVLQATEHIPYGETRTYSQVAEMIERPGASRAVGSALAANPVPILIPCHRVIPARGGIGGYAYGPDMKRFLINLEAGSR